LRGWSPLHVGRVAPSRSQENISSRQGRAWGAIVPFAGAVLAASRAYSSARSNSECDDSSLPAEVDVALLQLKVTAEKKVNWKTAVDAIREAVKKGAKLVVLPEIWNGPYATKSFPEYCEPIPEVGEAPKADVHPTLYQIAEEAKALSVPIVAGSISEKGPNGQVYNTSVVLSPEGKCLAKHRKVHLFDIDIPGKMTFKESETLTGGANLTTVSVPIGDKAVRIGIGICYDVRFPELSLAMRNNGAHILVFPGAFNTTTGPMHWALLMRARAVDTQCFVLACSPSRNPDGYPAYGHSMAVDPRGNILAEAGHEPEMVMAKLPLSDVLEVRKQIPVGFQRRHDVYAKL